MSSVRENAMMSPMQSLIAVALDHQKADLVLKNATYLNVFTNDWEQGDIAISQGRIAGIGSYQGNQEMDVSGRYVTPGLIDSHIHLESSLVTPNEFAKAVLPHGTTAVVTDPHEIANVLGMDGIRYLLQATASLPLDVWFMLPSCVPATEEDESGADLHTQDILAPLRDPRVLGLAEMMNYPGVLRGAPEVLSKIQSARAAGKVVDGHAPSLSGNDLNAYVACGIQSDHECSTAAEAMEKLRKGQWIMIREGTAAQNLEALVPLLVAPYADRCLFATDDKHPEHLLQKGHVDGIVAKAVRLGADPILALKIASYNAARAFHLQDYGAIAPGYWADMAVWKDLHSFEALFTFKHGQAVYTGGAVDVPLPTVDPALAKKALHTFHMPVVTPQHFHRTQPAGLLQMVGNQIITENGGFADSVDTKADIVKIAVLERHKGTGHMGVGYLKGYGLARGAIATSIAHDSHNLIVVGATDADMALAANRVHDLEGGIVLAAEGRLLCELPLPIAGLMSQEPLEVVNAALESLKKQAAALGVSPDVDPFMTLSFMSLPVIPALRILTHGVFDVTTWHYVSH